MGPQPLGDSGPQFLIRQQLLLPLGMMIHHPHPVRLPNARKHSAETYATEDERVALVRRRGPLAISGMRIRMNYRDGVP